MDILLSGTLALGEQRSGYIGAHNTRSKYRRCSAAFKQDIHPAGISLPVRVDDLGEGGMPLALSSPVRIQDKRKGAFPAEQIICNSRKCSPFLRTNLTVSSTASGEDPLWTDAVHSHPLQIQPQRRPDPGSVPSLFPVPKHSM